MAVLVMTLLAYGTGGVPQACLLTILLLCPMFGVPSTRVASILAADLLVDRIHTCCKTIAAASVIAIEKHLSSDRATLSSASTTVTANATAVQQVKELASAFNEARRESLIIFPDVMPADMVGAE